MGYRCQSSTKGAYGDNSVERTRCAYIQGKVRCNECDAVHNQLQPALSGLSPPLSMHSIQLGAILVHFLVEPLVIYPIRDTRT